jgi:hypothetical protein
MRGEPAGRAGRRNREERRPEGWPCKYRTDPVGEASDFQKMTGSGRFGWWPMERDPRQLVWYRASDGGRAGRLLRSRQSADPA